MRYRLLGNSGLRVSELCLGTMTFGEAWGWGADHDESRRIFDAFAASGGTFVDTSNNYTDGTSERYVGEFVAQERERFVVATKYSLSTRRGDPNAGGNQRKNMLQAVEASLRRLGTDYVDLLYLHMWDYTTPVEEVMRAFDDLVRAGTVMYAGFSDTPAWVVSRGDALALLRGWPRVAALQVPYNLGWRDAERDLVPMARMYDIAVTAWAPLGQGALTGRYTSANPGQNARGDGFSAQELAAADRVVALAAEIGRPAAQIALNWLRQQRVIPIVGARTLAQMQENLGCLDWELTPAQRQTLDEGTRIRLGFPQGWLNSEGVRGLIFGDTYALIENHRVR